MISKMKRVRGTALIFALATSGASLADSGPGLPLPGGRTTRDITAPGNGGVAGTGLGGSVRPGSSGVTGLGGGSTGLGKSVGRPGQGIDGQGASPGEGEAPGVPDAPLSK